MNKRTLLLAFSFTLLSILLISSCGDNGVVNPSDSAKTSDFDSPEEFLQNPDVQSARNSSGIAIYNGDNPPRLAGEYDTDGTIIKADPRIEAFRGEAIRSEVCLFNQTASGGIDFRERVGGIEAWGSGGYITGESGQFTVWQESVQSGEEAGLPENCTVNVVLIISGTKISGGDLDARGLTVVTDISGCGGDAKGVWWMWQADFLLKGDCQGYSMILDIF